MTEVATKQRFFIEENARTKGEDVLHSCGNVRMTNIDFKWLTKRNIPLNIQQVREETDSGRSRSFTLFPKRAVAHCTPQRLQCAYNIFFQLGRKNIIKGEVRRHYSTVICHYLKAECLYETKGH